MLVTLFSHVDLGLHINQLVQNTRFNFEISVMLHRPALIFDQELVIEMLALLLLERNNCHNKHIWFVDILPRFPSIILFRISCLCKIEADAIFLAHVKINTSQATKLHKNHHLLVCVWSGRLNNVKI